MNPFHVYVLECCDKSFYVGHTEDLANRIEEHQTGKRPGYTAARLPVKFLYARVCETREQAKALEIQVKNWSRKKKIAWMRGDVDKLSEHAKKKFEK